MASLQSYRKKLWVDTDILFEQIILMGLEPAQFQIEYIESPKFGRNEYCIISYYGNINLPAESKCEFYFLPYDELRPHATVYTPHTEHQGEYREHADPKEMYVQFGLWLECLNLFAIRMNHWFVNEERFAKVFNGNQPFTIPAHHMPLYHYLQAANMTVYEIHDLMHAFVKAEMELKKTPELIPYTHLGLVYALMNRAWIDDDKREEAFRYAVLHCLSNKKHNGNE